MKILFGFLSAAILASAVQTRGEVIDDEEVDVHAAIAASILRLKDRLDREKALELSGGKWRSPEQEHVCYEHLGCFHKNGTFSHIRTLPEAPQYVNTTFLLYTPHNPHRPEVLDYSDVSTIVSSKFDESLPLKVVVHGFGGRNNITWMWQLKNAFLSKFPANVVLVEWSEGAKIPFYVNAVANTELVGRQIAALLLLLKERKGLQEKNVHVIGFSLGAQVAGFVGERLTEIEGTKPGRITGLDAAAPLFEDYGEDVHLSFRDADFVDIIHTNADSFFSGGLGIGKPVGHVDFYPNGGRRQPGCKSTVYGALGDVFTGKKTHKCNHERAYKLFLESIQSDGPCQFTAYSCTEEPDAMKKGKCARCSDVECGRLGYNVQGRGSLYLLTHDSSPYCSQNIRISIKLPKTLKKSHGKLELTLVDSSGENNFTVTEHEDRLLPGDVVTAIVNGTHDFEHVQAAALTYHRYNGWFSSGTKTLHVDSVVVEDIYGTVKFQSCHKELELQDQQRVFLHPSSEPCDISEETVFISRK